MENKNIKNLIFVDCEANGKSPSTGRLTEFGAAIYPSKATFHGVLVGKGLAEEKEIFISKNVPEKFRNFRIEVIGGGCSGFQYKLGFYEIMPTDQVFESFGVKIICDPKSYLFVVGSEIDYVGEVMGSGFVVNNPNARGTCGCGESFTA